MAKRLLSLVHGPQEAAEAHERAFVVRYEHLRAIARRLAGREQSLVDDLLQDAYIQFTLARPRLESIRHLDAYLAMLLRNLHISWIRRTAAHRVGHVAIEDYDSAELAVALSRGENEEHARRLLARICDYACRRKDSSKAAGVLILRFFHGFYPSEIARILRTTPRVVRQSCPARSTVSNIMRARGCGTSGRIPLSHLRSCVPVMWHS